MQKSFFFLLILLNSGFCWAQTLDINSLELSVWGEDTAASKMHVRALIKIESNQKKAVFNFYPSDIKYLKLREGRLKQNLSYTQSEGLLEISLPANKEIIQVEVDYWIDLRDGYYKDIVNRKEFPLGLNTQSLFMGLDLGTSGSFFPSNPNDLFSYTLNITLNKGINSGTCGELEYVVNHKNGKISQFWKASKEISAESFYLIIGDFKEFDEEDIAEEYELSQADMSQFLARDIRSKHAGVLDHIEKEFSVSFEDETLLKLDSLIQHVPENLLISHADIERSMDSEEWKKEMLFFWIASEKNTSDASLHHYRFNAKHEGEDWENNFIDRHWNEILSATDSAQVNLLTFQLKIERWLTLISANDKNYEASQHFANQLKRYNLPPRIKLSYRYREGKEYVYLKQDTSITRPYSVPFTFKIFNKDTVIYHKAVSSEKVVDTLSFPQSGPPQAVLFDFGKDFPGLIKRERADIYDLYIFSNGEGPLEKKAALQRLFSTSNPNLFSTVLGIAMDSKDADIRLEAVNKSESLNVPAQFKLKDTLIKLSNEDPIKEIRDKAQNLVLKYYPNK